MSYVNKPPFYKNCRRYRLNIMSKQLRNRFELTVHKPIQITNIALFMLSPDQIDTISSKYTINIDFSS